MAYHLRLGNHADMLSPAPMPFKTNRQSGTLPRLSGYSMLGFVGPEAGAFLQAQTMNDVRALAFGQWHWNGWLNPKGRVIALFALLRLGEGDYIAVLPDYPASELLPLLQRFVFRTKVRLQVVNGLAACADLEPRPPGENLARDLAAGNPESGLCLDFSSETVRRHLLLLPESDEIVGQPKVDSDSEWLRLDLAHGLPRLAQDQREAWTPQMLSLDRLHAFSLKKGCYPGQEIVARTHYLGQARRGLRRVLGRGLARSEPVRNEQSEPIGSVICVTADAREGLAVVQLDRVSRTALVGDQQVDLPDFLEGLQRPV